MKFQDPDVIWISSVRKPFCLTIWLIFPLPIPVKYSTLPFFHLDLQECKLLPPYLNHPVPRSVYRTKSRLHTFCHSSLYLFLSYSAGPNSIFIGNVVKRPRSYHLYLCNCFLVTVNYNSKILLHLIPHILTSIKCNLLSTYLNHFLSHKGGKTKSSQATCIFL